MGRTTDPKDWRALTDEWVASGESLREFCRERAISRSSLSRWARRFGYGRSSRPASSTGPLSERRHAPVEVVLPGGILVRVPSENPPERIAAIVTALIAATSTHGGTSS